MQPRHTPCFQKHSISAHKTGKGGRNGPAPHQFSPPVHPLAVLTAGASPYCRGVNLLLLGLALVILLVPAQGEKGAGSLLEWIGSGAHLWHWFTSSHSLHRAPSIAILQQIPVVSTLPPSPSQHKLTSFANSNLGLWQSLVKEALSPHYLYFLLVSCQVKLTACIVIASTSLLCL